MKIDLGELEVEYGGIIDVENKRLFSLMADGPNNAGLRVTSIPHKLNNEVMSEFCGQEENYKKYRVKIILERVE